MSTSYMRLTLADREKISQGIYALETFTAIAQRVNRPTSTIGKILKQEGLVKVYRKKKITYVYVRAERKPGELVEIDVKYVPQKIAGKR